jgi:hypothetical protein
MFVWYGLAIVTREVLQQSKKLVEKFEGLAAVRQVAALAGRFPRPGSETVTGNDCERTEDWFVA